MLWFQILAVPLIFVFVFVLAMLSQAYQRQRIKYEGNEIIYNLSFSLHKGVNRTKMHILLSVN